MGLLCVCGRYSEVLLCSLAACNNDILVEEKKRLHRNMLPDYKLAFWSQCGICLEHRFAIVSNKCGHQVCFDCLHTWISSRIADVHERCAILTRASTVST